MTRGKIWDYLHNGVGEERRREEKSVIISSSSDDDDEDKDPLDGDSDGDGIKVKINRKLVLLRDDEPNRRVARTLFVWGGPVSGTRGPEFILRQEH